MPDRDISPMPDSRQPHEEGHYRAEDDIELPPMPESEALGPAEAGYSTGAGKPKSISAVLGAVTLIAAVTVGGWLLMRGGSAEKTHPNWQHVAAAADASDSSASRLVHLDTAGNAHVLPSIEVSAADQDRSSTRQIRMALRRGNLMMATAALQAAQTMPSASQNPDVAPPQIAADSELATALRDGRSELFQIELFDCCDEDGDIVEVTVNGSSFATVPIMHGGTMLSIPLQQGSNRVTIRGVQDGGGGVTLSFRTSRGEYFAQAMRVGQEYPMEVVVR
jgi:hypothetical protein